MRVIYMTSQFHKCEQCPKLVVGTEYNTNGEERANGKLYYSLVEIPPEIVEGQVRTYYYNAKNFATLPDQEPSVVNEEEQEAIIYQR